MRKRAMGGAMRGSASVMEAITQILSALGAATLVYAVTLLFCTLYQYALYSFSYAPYKGEWAVVTGASGDIGGAFVEQLAERGLNVVLLARSERKMDDIAKRVRDKYGVETVVHAFDFAAAKDEQWHALRQVLTDKSPAVLVNNVGISLEMPTDLLDVHDDVIERMVTVNIHSTNRMTKMLLPHMRRNRKGIILCLASGGGAVTPAPMLTPYAGTKAYNDAFAVSLHAELRAHSIYVHSLTPFFVAGSMAKMRRSLTVPTPRAFVAGALRQVGSTPRLNPYIVHHVMACAIRSLPLLAQTQRVDALHRSIRARALRKKARAAKQS